LSQGDIDFGLIPLLDDKAADRQEESATDEGRPPFAVIKDTLGERCLRRAGRPQRLTSSASCLVAGGDGRDRQLERFAGDAEPGLRSQSRSSRSICAILWWRRLPGPRMRLRTCRFLLLEQAADPRRASCPKTRRHSPAGFNQLVLRGIKL